jgi:hypothetical protein
VTFTQWFDIIYLTALMALLVFMAVNSYLRGRREEKMITILVNVSAKNATNAEEAVKAVQTALAMLKEQ